MKFLQWLAISAILTLAILCFGASQPRCITTIAAPPMPVSRIINPGILHTNKPLLPPISYHWSTVWFYSTNASNYLTELDESTNLKTWWPVAYYPCDGTWKSFTVSNALVPIAWFRAKSIPAAVTNLKLILH